MNQHTWNKIWKWRKIDKNDVFQTIIRMFKAKCLKKHNVLVAPSNTKDFWFVIRLIFSLEKLLKVWRRHIVLMFGPVWLFTAGPCPYNIIRNIKIKWTHLYNHFTVDCMVQVWIITMSTLCKLKIFQWFRDVPSPMTLVRTSGLSEISPDSRVQNQSTFPRQIFMSELNPRIPRFL